MRGEPLEDDRGGHRVFFFCRWACLRIIPTAFIPPEDYASSELDIELPPGGTLEDTSRVSAAAAAILRQSPEVTDIVEFVGGDDGEIRNAVTYISLVPRSERAISQKEWEQKMMPLLARVPTATLTSPRAATAATFNCT